MPIKFSYINSKIPTNEILKRSEEVKKIHNEFKKDMYKDEKMLGWYDVANIVSEDEIQKIKKVAKKIRDTSDILIVIGIGGSYLGSDAVISALSNSFQKDDLEVVFAGCNISSSYLSELIDYVCDKDFSINVISKSGTTTESAIAFRILREVLENKYGIAEARDRIYVTTDAKKGALKKISEIEGYETFVIKDNVGGRFSVLSPVGLLPIAAAGFDICELLDGAIDAQNRYNDEQLKYNNCYQYAVLRNILYESGKDIEFFVNYEPKMRKVSNWLQQLFAESEGKDKKGIFPTGANNTTDLHSIGQYIQDGKRNLFETVIDIENTDVEIIIPNDEDNHDNLNYLAGKSMGFVNKVAKDATIKAHVDGNVPNIEITLEKLDEKNLGELIYFFELSVAMSGMLLGINPFNQDGVEAYKKNMFEMLGKPM